MIENHIHHTFWCFNENSGDTGGLVYDNFGKWDEDKYALVEPALWQTDSGKFISLDHQTALGANGISLGDYYGGSTNPTDPTTPTESPIKGDANGDENHSCHRECRLERKQHSRFNRLDFLESVLAKTECLTISIC